MRWKFVMFFAVLISLAVIGCSIPLVCAYLVRGGPEWLRAQENYVIAFGTSVVIMCIILAIAFFVFTAAWMDIEQRRSLPEVIAAVKAEATKRNSYTLDCSTGLAWVVALQACVIVYLATR